MPGQPAVAFDLQVLGQRSGSQHIDHGFVDPVGGQGLKKLANTVPGAYGNHGFGLAQAPGIHADDRVEIGKHIEVIAPEFDLTAEFIL